MKKALVGAFSVIVKSFLGSVQTVRRVPGDARLLGASAGRAGGGPDGGAAPVPARQLLHRGLQQPLAAGPQVRPGGGECRAEAGVQEERGVAAVSGGGPHAARPRPRRGAGLQAGPRRPQTLTILSLHHIYNTPINTLMLPCIINIGDMLALLWGEAQLWLPLVC